MQCIIESDQKYYKLYKRIRSSTYKGQTKFQDEKNHFKRKITQGTISRASSDVEQRWNIQTLDTYLLNYKKSQQNHLFSKIQSIKKALSQMLCFQNVKLVEGKTFCGY